MDAPRPIVDPRRLAVAVAQRPGQAFADARLACRGPRHLCLFEFEVGADCFQYFNDSLLIRDFPLMLGSIFCGCFN